MSKEIRSQTPITTSQLSGIAEQELDPAEIDEFLRNVNLEKPKTSFKFFLNEIKEKGNYSDMGEEEREAEPKWNDLPYKEKKRYEELAAEDKKRYEENLSLARKYLQLVKPLKEGSTSYRIFLEEHIGRGIERDEEVAESKQKAREEWKQMSAEEKRAWDIKAEELQDFYDELRENQNYISPFALFYKDQATKAKEKGISMDMKKASALWKKATPRIKELYADYAQTNQNDRKHMRDLYIMVSGIRPKPALGPYRIFLMHLAKENRIPKGKDFQREASKLWENLPDDKKEKYFKLAQRDKASYILKKIEYDASLKKSMGSMRARTAYNFFTHSLEGRQMEYPKGKFFQYAISKWEKMDSVARSQYEKMAEEDRERIEKKKEEMKNRIYDMPKRGGRSSYNYYIADNIKKLKEEYPHKTSQEIFSMAADMWKHLSHKEKQKYEVFVQKELRDYEKNLESFEENGYYVRRKERRRRRTYSHKEDDSDTSKSTKRKKPTY
jgi:hypothetical protein